VVVGVQDVFGQGGGAGDQGGGLVRAGEGGEDVLGVVAVDAVEDEVGGVEFGLRKKRCRIPLFCLEAVEA
jgi:hypothetical protein